MTCSSSVNLVIRRNITPRHSSKVSSEDKLSVVISNDVGGHGRAHGGRVPRVPRGGYAPDRQNKVSGRLRELMKKKLSVFFSAGTARSATAWLPVNCVWVPRLFEQLINITLCPAFLRKFVCQPLRCIPLQIQTFFQNLVLVA